MQKGQHLIETGPGDPVTAEVHIGCAPPPDAVSG
jgi:hypothetical protein